MKTTQILLTVAILSANFGAAQASLINRGGGLIYDSVLNVTWLQDTNYAMTSGYDLDGKMTWNEATTWAANLSYYDSVRNITYDDWRLPTVSPINGNTFNTDITYNGTTDYSFNVSEQGTAYAGSTASEMAHLFYNTLDNKGTCDPYTSTKDACTRYGLGTGLANVGPFTNLQALTYWSGTSYSGVVGMKWNFSFFDGSQGTTYMTYNARAIAVRNGDIYGMSVDSGNVPSVPVPTTAWLLGSGLLGLIGVARRKAA